MCPSLHVPSMLRPHLTVTCTLKTPSIAPSWKMLRHRTLEQALLVSAAPPPARLSGPIPGLKPPQWQLLALALLHALAVHHVPALRSALYTDPAAVTTPTASSADGPRGSEASSSDLGDAGEGQGQGEQGRRQGQVALRAGGVHASTCHPRLRDMLQRIGFDVHYLGALVDLMCSPDL